MPVAPQQPFLTSVLSAAIRCAADTGLWTSVVLAQWADETAWGTARAWVTGNNPAGISPGGKIAKYPSQAAGYAAWIETMNLKTYDSVRAAKAAGPIAQATALGLSPWAGGHYTSPGGRPGAALVEIIETNNLADFDGSETIITPTPSHNPEPQVEEPQMQCTDLASGFILATDENGALYVEPDIAPPLVVGNLVEHPNFDAGDEESGNTNPCVGIVSRQVDGAWGWAFVTRPTSGTGSFGPYDLYHFGRDGVPH